MVHCFYPNIPCRGPNKSHKTLEACWIQMLEVMCIKQVFLTNFHNNLFCLNIFFLHVFSNEKTEKSRKKCNKYTVYTIYILQGCTVCGSPVSHNYELKMLQLCLNCLVHYCIVTVIVILSWAIVLIPLGHWWPTDTIV